MCGYNPVCTKNEKILGERLRSVTGSFGGMGWSFSGITAQGATFWLIRELIPITWLAADCVYNQCACLPRVSVHSSFVGNIPIVIPSNFLFPALPPVISIFVYTLVVSTLMLHSNNLLYSYYTTCHLITTMFVSWLIHYCFDALLQFMVNKHVDHPVLS